MPASYDDIISRISTPPIWYDEYAVPRYCTFEPTRSASISIGEIALAEISCQSCKRRFRVALSAVNCQEQSIAEAIKDKTLHYGDPPSHSGDAFNVNGCSAGDSMNSEPRKVLEYWRRHDQKYMEGDKITNVAWFHWVRDASLEIDIEPEWVR